MMPRKLGMFGAASAYRTPDFGAPLNGADLPLALLGGVAETQTAPLPPATKPGFFARDGLGVSLLGNLADGALALNGMRPTFGPAQDARRAQQQALAAHQQERAESLQDWQAKQAYEAAHPAPSDFDHYLVAAGIDPTSPQGQALYKQKAEASAAPPLMAVSGFDAQGNPTQTFVPRTASGIAGASAPAVTGPAIGTVVNGHRYIGGDYKNPASWQAAGGAPSRGGATFR